MSPGLEAIDLAAVVHLCPFPLSCQVPAPKGSGSQELTGLQSSHEGPGEEFEKGRRGCHSWARSAVPLLYTGKGEPLQGTVFFLLNDTNEAGHGIARL